MIIIFIKNICVALFLLLMQFSKLNRASRLMDLFIFNVPLVKVFLGKAKHAEALQLRILI